MMHGTMSKSKLDTSGFDAQEWESRKRANKRLGYVFAVIALIIFLGSIWKYRPL
jgi:hypothetical protein